MSITKTVNKLQSMGFNLSLKTNGNISIKFKGEPSGNAKALLEELKIHKDEAVRYLQGGTLNPRIEGQKARELLKKQGWFAVQSQTLGGEIVIWIRDGKVIIPMRWQNHVRYTMKELQALAEDGGITEEGLKQIHEAKKMFNGEVKPLEGFKWPEN